jgi:pimeloyl-ACP methyl ester carboxylesterase
LRYEHRFHSVVAECPFATFDGVAFDRMSQFWGVWRPAFWPIINGGFLYARGRYGLDLRQASPAAAVRSTNVPVLLIHGVAGQNIPIRHSRELHALNPRATELWELPRAGHVDALRAEPDAYVRAVTDWFQSH